jgi:hypothetical protein
MLEDLILKLDPGVKVVEALYTRFQTEVYEQLVDVDGPEAGPCRALVADPTL